MNAIEKLRNGGGMAIIDKLSHWAGIFTGQRHLTAVRESFVALMPLIIVASLFILINNVILNSNSGLVGFLGLQGEWIAHAQQVGIRVYNGTLNILAFLATLMIAYRLANSYGEDGITYAIFALASLFVFFPMGVDVVSPSGEAFNAGGLVSGAEMGATGMFVGIFVALGSVEVFRRVSANDSLKIKMPDSVPPSVARSFNVLIPMIIVLTVFGTFAWALNHFFDATIHELVNLMIQTPLQNALQGLGGLIMLLLFQNGLWWAGIHGASITYPIVETTLLVAVQENAQAFAAGIELPHIVTKPFIDAFGFMGGGGQTIGLLVALWVAAKKSEHRAITKLSTPAAAFNINEPLIFGLPIMFNPILIIPFLLTPIVSVVIAYAATAMGLISKTSVIIPWTTPPVLSSFLATGGDWRAAMLSVIIIGISIMIYLPFVIAMNRQPSVSEGQS
ncbi:PTS sugar transporter subunit IIC [Vibrio parahaemolyticus]|uniref:PTS sugar transporter subunit IIC n=1 Tax=Vibrio parahaemolyticus TaxID=670 RepID=UPI000428ED16|nr:PTS transporter subunit EIIC [Vibrio parahaemolyticus]